MTSEQLSIRLNAKSHSGGLQSVSSENKNLTQHLRAVMVIE